MDLPSRQAIDQPRIDGSEEQLSSLRARLRSLDVIQDPTQLGRREIGVDQKPRSGTDLLLHALRSQGVTVLCRATALPHDGAIDGLPRRFFPYHRGFSLIGDADGGDLLRADPHLQHRLDRDAHLRCPDLGGVVLYPAVVRKELRKFPLHRGADLPVRVKNDAARGGCALIQCQQILLHFASIPPYRLALPQAYSIPFACAPGGAVILPKDSAPLRWSIPLPRRQSPR